MNERSMIKMMKIKMIKVGVGGCNGEISSFDDEVICDESELGFKMSEKEMEGGGNEGYMFWFLREDSEFFKMDGEDFIDEEVDCKLSEKYGYKCELDDYWSEVDKLDVKFFGKVEEVEEEEI